LSRAENPQVLPLFPCPQIRNAPFIPMDESQGLSGSVLGKTIKYNIGQRKPLLSN
jgi:hypothetical protein